MSMTCSCVSGDGDLRRLVESAQRLVAASPQVSSMRHEAADRRRRAAPAGRHLHGARHAAGLDRTAATSRPRRNSGAAPRMREPPSRASKTTEELSCACRARAHRTSPARHRPSAPAEQARRTLRGGSGLIAGLSRMAKQIERIDFQLCLPPLRWRRHRVRGRRGCIAVDRDPVPQMRLAPRTLGQLRALSLSSSVDPRPSLKRSDHRPLRRVTVVRRGGGPAPRP